ncbi:uncharacterized protein LOC144560244 [Carex rostrata]
MPTVSPKSQLPCCNRLLWNWTNSGVYNSKSLYKILSEGGLENWHFEYIWRCKATPTAKIFAYMVLHDKILTKAVLTFKKERNGEAVATWFHLSNLLSSPILKIEATVEKIWEESWRMVKRKGKMRKKEWVTRFICTAWHIWKNRNDILFNRHKTEAKALAYRSYKEMELWLKHV